MDGSTQPFSILKLSAAGKLPLKGAPYSHNRERMCIHAVQFKESQKMRHDMKNHLANIRSLIDSAEMADTVTLLDKIAENVYYARAEMIDTENSIADAIILS